MAADSRNGYARDSDLPGDVVEDILASERRRAMLSCLADSGGKVAVNDLAAAVCTGDDTTPGSVDSGALQSARREIYDRHLPKLTATGVVEYDSMREAVELVDEGMAQEL